MASFLGTSFFPRSRKNDLLFIACFIVVVLIGIYLRTSGLFRGLGEHGNIFHPDEPKQVMALFNFLNGDYIRYYGSLFYDGYPYGLNHLDEYLLRPLIAFFQPENPAHQALYYHARLLRLCYSLLLLLLAYHLGLRLFQERSAAVLVLLFMAIAPLPVTVTHFATGDIGVDLFTALCLFFLLIAFDRGCSLVWLTLCGFTVGAAFSAKYNGLLLAGLPMTAIAYRFFLDRTYSTFLKRCIALGVGGLAGLLLFTPQLLLDTKITLVNIAANFDFIKNYNVPREILEKPWHQKALIGLQNNTLSILSSLGYGLCLAYCGGVLLVLKKYFLSKAAPGRDRDSYWLALALFPLLALAVSLSSKYVVQPFHFSYLQLPLILIAFLFLVRLTSYGLGGKAVSFALGAVILMEFTVTSYEENYFWRLEDNGVHAANLPPSLYDREAFYTHRSDAIRSLYLEELGPSIFKNHNLVANGPDASFWHGVGTPSLPQVANPIGRDWIFLNGPTFPRNERKIVIRGENHGKTIRRYLVIPYENELHGIGLQSGSFATQAQITLGGNSRSVQLDPHKQHVIALQPVKWRNSGEKERRVRIIELTVQVPHNTLWLTLFTTEKDKEIFQLYGHDPEDNSGPPPPLPNSLAGQYFDALSRIRFLDHDLSWRVVPDKSIPMWEVALPAGRYILTSTIDGLADTSEIAISFEDARGESQPRDKQIFSVANGIQRVEYRFTKEFAPHQMRFVIHGRTGKCQVEHFTLTPDYRTLEEDLKRWRREGIPPPWHALGQAR